VVWAKAGELRDRRVIKAKEGPEARNRICFLSRKTDASGGPVCL
jgi:hypothetical protein